MFGFEFSSGFNVKNIQLDLSTGAYPEIFRGRGFEIFFVETGKFMGGFGIIFMKNSSKLIKFSQKRRGFGGQNPSLPP